MTPPSTQRMMTALPLLMEISSSLTQRRMLMSPLLIQRMMSPLSTQMTMLILLVQMTKSPLLMQQYHLLLKGEPVHSLFWRIHWPSGTANTPPFRRSNTQTDQEATGLAIIAVAEIVGRHWDLLKDGEIGILPVKMGPGLSAIEPPQCVPISIHFHGRPEAYWRCRWRAKHWQTSQVLSRGLTVLISLIQQLEVFLIKRSQVPLSEQKRRQFHGLYDQWQRSVLLTIAGFRSSDPRGPNKALRSMIWANINQWRSMVTKQLSSWLLEAQTCVLVD